MAELNGNVCLIGTPAEEGGAGKVKLLRNGAFDDVDFALMMHPSSGGANLVGRGGRAACTLTISFTGKGAHSSVPKNGINALLFFMCSSRLIFYVRHSILRTTSMEL